MRIKILMLVLVTCLLPGTASAQSQVIQLSDGSRLKGEVLSMQNGVYSIRTETLGVVSVPAARVTGIGSVSRETPATPGTPAAGGDLLQSVQSSIASNPGLMQKILSLKTDPDMQAVLNDPEVMKAVQNLDLTTLMNHPKFRALMQNQTVQEIQSGVP